MHPLLEEFCRASEFQPHFLRRAQRELREVVQPLLDEREALLAEYTAKNARIAELEAQIAELKAPKKPGRKPLAETVPA